MTLDSPSYMELKLHSSGDKTLVLRVPTFWDDVKKQWIGAIKTPTTKELITVVGKDSFELQNNFNKKLYDIFEAKNNLTDEVMSMFKEDSNAKMV